MTESLCQEWVPQPTPLLVGSAAVVPSNGGLANGLEASGERAVCAGDGWVSTRGRLAYVSWGWVTSISRPPSAALHGWSGAKGSPRGDFGPVLREDVR